MVRDDEFGRWNRPISLRGAVSGSRGLNPFGDYDAPLPGTVASFSAALQISDKTHDTEVPTRHIVFL